MSKIPGIKLKYIFILVISCVAFYFSLNKILFLVGLSQFSLSPKFEKKSGPEFLARHYSKNRKLSLLIPNDTSNDFFIGSFFKGLIKKRIKGREETGLEDYMLLIIDKFSENIFLDGLGLYGNELKDKAWDNFDMLFLKIIADPDLNALSCDVLIDSVRSDKIDKKYLPSLIYYLNWKRNFDLSRYLLDLGISEGNLSEEIQKSLTTDLSVRHSGLSKRSDVVCLAPAEIERKLHGLLKEKESSVSLGDNLLFDGGFKKITSLDKYWAFSDMSDGEPFSRGSFYGSIDEFENNSMRVMGFFIEKTEKRSPSRGGFLYNHYIPLKEKVYLFYFKYKTREATESPAFWLSKELKKEPRLKPTNMDWKECFYLFNNGILNLPEVKPLLRMWGLGSVWFDDIGLFEITTEGISIEKDLLIIR